MDPYQSTGFKPTDTFQGTLPQSDSPPPPHQPSNVIPSANISIEDNSHSLQSKSGAEMHQVQQASMLHKQMEFSLQACTPEAFHTAISQANAGPTVTVYSLEEYQNPDKFKSCFLSGNKTFGYAIKTDGDIVSVFKKEDAPSGTLKKVIPHALSNGGTHLDCFNGSPPLPYMYAPYNLVPVAKVKFDEQYKPDGWKVEEHGTPDVIFMVYKKDHYFPEATPLDDRKTLTIRSQVETDLQQIPEGSDYDKGKEIQQTKIDEFK